MSGSREVRVVVFQPLSDGKDSGDYIVLADRFAGRYKDPGRSQYPIFMQFLYRRTGFTLYFIRRADQSVVVRSIVAI